MHPPPEWKNKAKHKANEILAEFAEVHTLTIPIPIRDVIESYVVDANVITSLDPIFADGISGFARKEMDVGWVIALNGNECPERQRFSAAHELGHIVLMRSPRKIEYCSTDNTSWVERICDLFAGYLLMPEAHVRAYCRVSPRPYLEDIAKTFKVSRQVAEIQLKLLGLPFTKK
ncbi:MAG: ImmA/IrrE family metallo-endopeptidase [Patescibacteria group bacterium]